MKWGSGWQVGIRKAMWQHDKTLQVAAKILANECGIRHKTGEHDLCPKCKDSLSKIPKQQNQKL